MKTMSNGYFTFCSLKQKHLFPDSTYYHSLYSTTANPRLHLCSTEAKRLVIVFYVIVMERGMTSGRLGSKNTVFDFFGSQAGQQYGNKPWIHRR